MNSLDEILTYYIEITYNDIKKRDLYKALHLCEIFGRNFYQDLIVNLLVNDSVETSDSKQDFVYEQISDQIRDIITEHRIHLVQDGYIPLEKLNTIAFTIHLLQNLDNYELVDYRINANDEPRNIFIDLVTYFSDIESFELMFIIESVDEELIESIRRLINDRLKEIIIPNDFIENRNFFLTYTKKNESIGASLNAMGFMYKELEVLIALSPIDIEKNITELYNTNLTQATLNIWSLLILSSDYYLDVLRGLRENRELFGISNELFLKVEKMLLNMNKDFVTYVTESKKGFKEI